MERLLLPPPPFTEAELHRLQSVKDRYQRDRRAFKPAEQERLRFLRWLHRTDRLIS